MTRATRIDPEAIESGRLRDDAIDHALRMAHQSAAAHMAGGGDVPGAPWFERREATGSGANGFIHASGPGRTDTVPMSPAAGAYVLPADVVSGLGEGNSLAGARVVQEMLGTGPYGTPLPQAAHRTGPPPPPAPAHFAKGGKAAKPGTGTVPIVAAGGEYIIDPETVRNHPMLGNGDMNRGHRILDAFVRQIRRKTIGEMQKLPGPKR